jgi:hypothetical protein
VKRTAWILWFVVVALAWTRGPAMAQAGGLALQVTAGFDGYCHSSDWCPVYVVVSNEGADVEGELYLTTGGARAGTVPDVYARRVVLPARSRKRYVFVLPPAESSSRDRPTVQFVAGGAVLSAEEAVVTWLREEDRLYGVTSSSPSALNFLSDIAPAGGRGAVAHLDLRALPPDPLGWDGLDVLVLTDVDTTALSSQQRQALETWVTHGGHLVVGGGAGAARTVAGVADLLPVVVGGTRAVEDLEVLGEWWGASIAPGPYAVAEAALRDGEALVRQEDERGDLILLARRTAGAGKVDFLAFDAGLRPFARWDDNGRLWEFIVEKGGATVPRITLRSGYRAREAASAVPGLEPPSMLQILAFMLAYTLLIGPVNYLVLRKLDRRELAWLTVPALIVGFTACAYVTGFQVRGTTPIVHQLAAVYVPPGAGVGRASEVVGIFSPRRTTYDVWVAGAGARELPGDLPGGRALGEVTRPLRFVHEAEGLTVTGLRVDVGDLRPFVAEGYVDVSPVDADLKLVSSGSGRLRVEGRLRNGGVPLKDAVLLSGDQAQQLGDLGAGERVSVGFAYDVASGRTDIAELILGIAIYWEDPELYRRHQFLQAFFSPDGGPDLGRGIYLVGWAEEAPLPAEVVGRPFSAVETALYVYALPVAGLEPGATVVIPPGLITRAVEETAGGVDVWPGGLHMEPGSAAVFRFTTWDGVALRQVDELVLQLEGSSRGDTSHPPAVSLWNEASSGWERLDVGWGRHAIPDAGVYVTRSGAGCPSHGCLSRVLLRLDTDTEWPADVETLAITIKGQR